MKQVFSILLKSFTELIQVIEKAKSCYLEELSN